MQPILAESVPRPGRAVALVVALSIAASLWLIPGHHRSRHHEHHSLPGIGKCMQSSYSYVLR